MGTTRIKVIDLASGQEQIKTSRKHAEKMSGAGQLKEGKKGKKTPQEEISAKQKPDESLTGIDSIGDKQPATGEDIVKTEARESKIDSQEETSGISVKSPPPDPIKKSLHHQGKKYKEARGKIEDKNYTLSEALEIIEKTSYVKFDPTVEAHLNVSDKSIKANVKLPHPIAGQKQTHYLVFSDHKPSFAKASEGKQIIWGDEKTIDQIEKGELRPNRDFDIVYSSPKFMPNLAKIAKILGPKGLMPNPKNGTVTDDIKKVLSKDSGDTISLKSDPTAPIIHTKIGKLSTKDENLAENFKAVVLAIGQAKIKKATITSTMGPGVKVDIASL